ncbi:hypothetical protein [Planomonospora sp. ID91781]|uniref:hypothetical protein n=1 Tax=Planomonospora sp. ID91781 TaxID=2738135 RepID=UPI0035A93CB3
MTFSTRLAARALTALLGVSLVSGTVVAAGSAASADSGEGRKVMLKGSTTASYYWDDASGRNGDTGLPASGKPMQKGLAASPSWPLLTEGYVVYKGKKAPFFVGDRGPGEPSTRGIMLDLDAKTFADLTGGRFNPDTLAVNGNGGKGHIEVDYVITKWGPGVGKKNHPVPFETRAWSRKDRDPAEPVLLRTPAKPAEAPAKTPAKAAAKAPEAPAAGKAPQTVPSTPSTPSASTPPASPAPERAATQAGKSASAVVQTPAPTTLKADPVSASGEEGPSVPTGFVFALLLVAGVGSYAGVRLLSARLLRERG